MNMKWQSVKKEITYVMSMHLLDIMRCKTSDEVHNIFSKCADEIVYRCEQSSRCDRVIVKIPEDCKGWEIQNSHSVDVFVEYLPSKKEVLKC